MISPWHFSGVQFGNDFWVTGDDAWIWRSEDKKDGKIAWRGSLRGGHREHSTNHDHHSIAMEFADEEHHHLELGIFFFIRIYGDRRRVKS
jgi:hypothetical protein